MERRVRAIVTDQAVSASSNNRVLAVMKLTRLIFSSTALSLALHAQVPATSTQARPVALFLDLNSMDPADQTKARDAAIEYVQTKLGPSDVVAVMTYGS